MPTKTRTRPRLSAKTTDKHELYQLSVQAPETDTQFMARYFQKAAGRPLRLFREDFCGTAMLASQFVKNHRENHAIGVDLHRPTLKWAYKKNLSALTAQQRDRIQLIEGDVLDVHEPVADLTCALNFSYCVFKTRPALRAYFENARRGLRDDGMLMLDAWGGSETFSEQEESREVDGPDGESFTYVWDQAKFDPISHDITCKIHFEFDDGTRIDTAYLYQWRLWTLPEMQELMAEAGFHDIHVLWEGTDRKTNEGNGIYRRKVRGEADPSWIAYVVGRANA